MLDGEGGTSWHSFLKSSSLVFSRLMDLISRDPYLSLLLLLGIGALFSEMSDVLWLLPGSELKDLLCREPLSRLGRRPARKLGDRTALRPNPPMVADRFNVCILMSPASWIGLWGMNSMMGLQGSEKVGVPGDCILGEGVCQDLCVSGKVCE